MKQENNTNMQYSNSVLYYFTFLFFINNAKFQPNNIWEIMTTQNKDVGPDDGGIAPKLVDRIIINTIDQWNFKIQINFEYFKGTHK